MLLSKFCPPTSKLRIIVHRARHSNTKIEQVRCPVSSPRQLIFCREGCEREVVGQNVIPCSSVNIYQLQKKQISLNVSNFCHKAINFVVRSEFCFGTSKLWKIVHRSRYSNTNLEQVRCLASVDNCRLFSRRVCERGGWPKSNPSLLYENLSTSERSKTR